MKICIVTHEFARHTGQGRVNYEIAHYLAQQGYELYLVASEVASDLQGYSNLHSLFVKIPSWVKTAFLRHQIFALKSRSILRRHQFDIVQVNGGITYYSSDVNASHFVHSSWLKSTYHPSRYRFNASGIYQLLYTKLNASWEQRAYRRTQRVIAVSDFVKQSLAQDAYVPSEKIEVVWNGVDIEEFRPIRPSENNILRQTLGLAPEICISFFTGDIKSNRKNLDLVLQALTKLSDNHHLVVVGATDGSPYPGITQELGLADRVHFLGTRSDISTLLRCADVFTFPSHYDPCPLVILEALASGIPVITSNTVGSSALLQHRENGYILNDIHNPQELVDILQHLSNNPELRSRIGQMGRQTAEARSWQDMAKHYEAIYQTIGTAKRILPFSQSSQSSHKKTPEIQTK
jgi:glycosyltransferase involved in cell wall biosynthesis